MSMTSLQTILESAGVRKFITAVILFNAVILGLETSDMAMAKVGSVISTQLFSTDFPQWFGSLAQSAYSLFQIMTLESWSMGIVRPVMEVYPYAWAFFVPFIMVTTFAVVNLLVGLIVNSMQDAHSEEADQKTDTYRDEVLARLKAIEERMAQD
jgi:voltage-gated sodium channel